VCVRVGVRARAGLLCSNMSGPSDRISAQGWGLLSIDWSNWKGFGESDGWAKASPMDCEERLAQQAAITAAVSPSTRVFVYRNSILALPWFSSVRAKLQDPDYSNWFLSFPHPLPVFPGKHHGNLTCDTHWQPPKCSTKFHDTGQTPGYPSGDGNCLAPGCDCGEVPCAQYIFNHSATSVVNNQTFLQWFVDDYLFGPNGGGNKHVSGFFFDDMFNPEGATESAGSLKNLGLSVARGKQMSADYWANMAHVYETLVGRGKFSWQQLWYGQRYGTEDLQPPWPEKAEVFRYLAGTASPPPRVTRGGCATQLRQLCHESSPAQTRAMIFGYTPAQGRRSAATDNLTHFETDLANFLLVRGPHAYLGHGWTGCGPQHAGTAYEYPSALNQDYGKPLGLCRETAPGSSIFVREWTGATVQMDCRRWLPSITMKATQ
jgi:hypothetical protein